ncbi:MAG: flagellar biosynthesis protein FlgL [Sulfuricurvum sp.]|nr:flagellar biosynthesis protein FlgL [Sulfuricurvum sp.]
MRVTATSFYNNIYGENNKLNRQIFDVNKQIASGLKIQYSHENPGIFIDTLRLDDEIATLSQTKTSAQNASKLSTQTDTAVGEFVKTLESVKVKLLNAANDTNSEASLLAISKELRGLQNHLKTLANTSIGGQYIFSGTATTVKPIDANSNYQGNDKDIFSFLGSGIKQKYNITGTQLFFGEENTTNRTITTNVQLANLTDLYGTFKESFIKPSDTIADLMGDSIPATGATSHFYIQGTKTDGTSFKKHITLNDSDTVDTLLNSIKNAYGTDQVDISLNTQGQIQIIDKQKGSSKLDFHMVGAIDFNPAAGDAANITDPMYVTSGSIDNLQLAGTNDYATASNTVTPGLYVKEFTKSGFTTPVGVSNAVEGVNYDRTNFTQSGASLLSNVSQIVTSDNSFALPSTKLLDVASSPTLNTEQLVLSGKNISGAAFTMQIDLNTAGSTFSLDGGVTNYTIFDTNVPRAAVNSDQMTYQQLMDVVNMVLTNSIPATTATSTDYDNAIASANTLGSVSLDYAGKINFQDKTSPITKAQMSLYDAKSSDYNITTGSSLTFNANSALTVRDPKTDLFAQIEEMIKSVEEGKKFPNGLDSKDPRNPGVQNSIQMIDDLSDHVSRLQAEAGSYTQVMDLTVSRTDLLIISTKTLRSDVIDTDIAESTLKMQQLSLNYQALLSNISKVSKLSLVNYL